MNSRHATSERRERIFLAFLCQGLLSAAQRAEFEARLAARSWISHDHRAVFEALSSWRAEPIDIRNGLPARLTRLGFPDVAVEDYFIPPGVAIDTALGWLRSESSGEPRTSPIKHNPCAAKAK